MLDKVSAHTTSQYASLQHINPTIILCRLEHYLWRLDIINVTTRHHKCSLKVAQCSKDRTNNVFVHCVETLSMASWNYQKFFFLKYHVDEVKHRNVILAYLDVVTTVIKTIVIKFILRRNSDFLCEEKNDFPNIAYSLKGLGCVLTLLLGIQS